MSSVFMIGLYRSFNLSTLLEFLWLRMTLMCRLDQEVALVSRHLPEECLIPFLLCRYTLLRGMLWKLHICFVATTHWPLRHSTYGVLSVTMTSVFASHAFTLFMPLLYLRCAHSCFPFNIISISDYRWCPLNVSNNLEYMLRRLFFTLLSAVSSVILMWRTYAFSGMKRWVLTVLSTVLLSFIGATIWVTIKELGRLSRWPSWSRYIADIQWNRSDTPVRFGQTYGLFRRFSPTTSWSS